MRRLVAILIVGLVALVAAGPATAGAAWTLGFKGGLALGDLGGDDVPSDELGIRTGFAGGVFAQVEMSENFGVRLEGLYHMKGASEDSASVKATIELDYFEFPVLLVGQVPLSESATFSAFAGPVIAFNTGARIAGSVGGFSASFDIKDYIASFEFALAVGLGASFDAGSATITIDGRYQLGLTTVDDGFSGTTEDADVKNRGWVFMAGVGFPIGGE